MPPRAKGDKPKGRRKPRALNDNQIAFVDRYFATLPRNATKAYQEVYGGSESVAGTCGARLLKDARIVELIAQREKAIAAPFKLKAGKIRREIAALAHSDLRHYRIDDAGEVVLAEGAPADAMRALSRVKIKRRTIPQSDDKGNALPPIVEVEADLYLWDKPSALRLAAQIRGMVVKRVGGPDGEPIPDPSKVATPTVVKVMLVASKDGKPVELKPAKAPKPKAAAKS